MSFHLTKICFYWLTMGLLFGTWLLCVAYLIFHPFCFWIFIILCVCVCVCVCFQEEAALPLSTHSQAVSIRHPEADALPELSHSENNSKIAASLSLCNSFSMWIMYHLSISLSSPLLSASRSTVCIYNLTKDWVISWLTWCVCCWFRGEKTLLNLAR